MQKSAEPNNFQKDLDNPQAGLDSDLYSAISPIISSEDDAQLKGYDADRIKELKESVRKGLVGLEYMTGLKKNKGETFYDKHPVQAVATNLLGNSDKIGVGVGLGGMGLNALRQYQNMAKVRPAEMSRTPNVRGDRSNPANLLDESNGPLREDISRMFGDFEGNAETRMKLLDQLTDKTNPNGPQNELTTRLQNMQKAEKKLKAIHQRKQHNIQKGRATNNKQTDALLRDLSSKQDIIDKAMQAKKSKLFADAKSSSGMSTLQDYVNFHESLRRAKAQGGFKGYVGEGLHNVGPTDGIIGKIKKHLLPGKYQAIGDLAEINNLTGANPRWDDNLIQRIVEEYHGSPLHDDPQGRAFLETTLKNLRSQKHQQSGLSRLGARVKTPLAAGAAIGLGGQGLYQLVKAIQDKTYSNKQIRDWKQTLLQSRGKHEEAKKVK